LFSAASICRLSGLSDLAGLSGLSAHFKVFHRMEGPSVFCPITTLNITPILYDDRGRRAFAFLAFLAFFPFSRGQGGLRPGRRSLGF